MRKTIYLAKRKNDLLLTGLKREYKTLKEFCKFIKLNNYKFMYKDGDKESELTVYPLKSSSKNYHAIIYDLYVMNSMDEKYPIFVDGFVKYCNFIKKKKNFLRGYSKTHNAILFRFYC